MKKLMVFLHGKGAAANAHHDLLLRLAVMHEAELLAFNAPFPHPRKAGGFMWFDKTPQETGHFMNVEQFNQSVSFIISKIEETLKTRGGSWQDVILCGHSQGGMMAVHLGLTMSPAKVISLCGDFPIDFNYAAPIDKNVPIIWVEAAQDNFLPQWRKDSYHRLQDWGCNLTYRVSPHSTHDELNSEIAALIG